MVLFKLVLIQHLFGICSLRQTMRDAEVNVAYRWFLGYIMSQQLPHFAAISYAFRHRFTSEVIEGVFRWILEEVARAGYLSAEVVFVDGTHIKANANLKKQMKKAIPIATKRYAPWERGTNENTNGLIHLHCQTQPTSMQMPRLEVPF